MQIQHETDEIQYTINKGVNKSIEFRGLKTPYIYYLAIGLAVLLLLFCVLYICGLPVYLVLVLIIALGAGLFIGVGRLSHRFGSNGLKKYLANRKVPLALRPVGQHSPASLGFCRVWLKSAKGS